MLTVRTREGDHVRLDARVYRRSSLLSCAVDLGGGGREVVPLPGVGSAALGVVAALCQIHAEAEERSAALSAPEERRPSCCAAGRTRSWP